MTIEKTIEYILHTPFNTNRAILIGILEDLIISHGGNLDSDDSHKHIIYDGGTENENMD